MGTAKRYVTQSELLNVRDVVYAAITQQDIKDAPPSPPETPKGDESELQATAAAITAASPNTGGHSNPTAEAVSELLITMKNTLGSLGKTFDLMGNQTMQVASLGPAVEALNQVRRRNIESALIQLISAF